MPLLVADCPRCGSESMTFDITAQVFRHQESGWVNTQEVFSVCRNCHKPTIFSIRSSLEGRRRYEDLSKKFSADPSAILSYKNALNDFYEVRGYVSLRDQLTTPPPDHLPRT